MLKYVWCALSTNHCFGEYSYNATVVIIAKMSFARTEVHLDLAPLCGVVDSKSQHSDTMATAPRGRDARARSGPRPTSMTTTMRYAGCWILIGVALPPHIPAAVPAAVAVATHCPKSRAPAGHINNIISHHHRPPYHRYRPPGGAALQ